MKLHACYNTNADATPCSDPPGVLYHSPLPRPVRLPSAPLPPSPPLYPALGFYANEACLSPLSSSLNVYSFFVNALEHAAMVTLAREIGSVL